MSCMGEIQLCIKAAIGFISTGSVAADCNRLLEEYRSFPQYVLKEDSLQVRRMTLPAIVQALERLPKTTTLQDTSAGDQPSITLMRQNTKVMYSYNISVFLLTQEPRHGAGYSLW